MKQITRNTLYKYSNAIVVEVLGIVLLAISIIIPTIFTIIWGFKIVYIVFPLTVLAGSGKILTVRRREKEISEQGYISKTVLTLSKIENDDDGTIVYVFDDGRVICQTSFNDICVADNTIIGQKYWVINITLGNFYRQYLFSYNKWELSLELQSAPTF